MLSPKKMKYRKVQLNRKNLKKERISKAGNEVSFGAFGLKAMSRSRIRSNQIESARRVITKTAGKTGKVWIRIFPNTPFTKKPSEVKMGKGKGDVEGFEFRVLPGRIIFEIDNVSDEIAEQALIKASKKLPGKLRVVKRL